MQQAAGQAEIVVASQRILVAGLAPERLVEFRRRPSHLRQACMTLRSLAYLDCPRAWLLALQHDLRDCSAHVMSIWCTLGTDLS